MLEKVNVFYEGWGERWQWGTLATTTALTGRPLIVFQYSDEAKRRGLELSSYTLPLEGSQLRRDFPHHQLQLPGPVYDALPDGWGITEDTLQMIQGRINENLTQLRRVPRGR